MKAKVKTKTTVNVPRPVWRRCKALAAQRGMSTIDVLRAAVEAAVIASERYRAFQRARQTMAQSR